MSCQLVPLSDRGKPVIAVESMGKTPMLPTMEVVPAVEMPALDKITKSPAVPRLTGCWDPLSAVIVAAMEAIPIISVCVEFISL